MVDIRSDSDRIDMNSDQIRNWHYIQSDIVVINFLFNFTRLTTAQDLLIKSNQIAQSQDLSCELTTQLTDKIYSINNKKDRDKNNKKNTYDFNVV